jgi:nicotinamide-nucleotide amidase
VNAEVIAIGTELLLGFVVNTNTATLGRMLAGLGIDCTRQVTIGDNPARLAETIRTALGRADLVITCGGLGPTVDDVTLETISRTTGRRLILNRPILRGIEARFKRQKIRMPASNRRQALLPEGAVPFPNTVVTAPGFMLKFRMSEWANRRVSGPAHSLTCSLAHSQILIALPGPPVEMLPMVERHLVPRLKKLSGGRVLRSRTLKLTGATESEVDAKVRDLLALEGAATVGIYAHPGQVDLRITASGRSEREVKRRIAAVERRILARVRGLFYGADDETLEETVGHLLKKRRLTLSVAESCTGGLIQHRITEVPGASDYFLGGVVSYANTVKNKLLSIPPTVLKRDGAVSPQTAKLMADGIRRLTGADLGLAVTGIAGPTGGSHSKPVGLVYIALSSGGRTSAHRFLFSGSRSTIKFKASQAALGIVRQYCPRSR